MQVEIGKFLKPLDVVAVALSGGSDSMALLHFLSCAAEKHRFKVIALNVEHGIRGEDSEKDTEFVKDYCSKIGIPLLCYKVDSIKKAKESKLSIEQAARALRYECFYDAIESGKCSKVATAHHCGDNVESVLLNLFRGTGIKGLTGIKDNFENKIIRPLLGVKKEDVIKYVKENNIPFVTDQTNFDDNYTRNFLRLNVIPKIKEVFPEVDVSISRLIDTATAEDEYLDDVAQSALTQKDGKVEIAIPIHRAVFMRAAVKALKLLGVEKDWERVHLIDAYSLVEKENGSSVNLPKGVVACREYDRITFYLEQDNNDIEIPFRVGTFDFNGKTLDVTPAELDKMDLKSGLILDADKLPKGTVIRTKRDGDVFKKFGGGTKSLGDFLTDKKIPRSERDRLPLLAYENKVLAVFGVAISDDVKVDGKTANAVKLEITAKADK